MTLDDAALVRAEYATEERSVNRSLYAWAVYEGADPREHALLALLEARPRRMLDVGCGTGEFAARAAAVLGVGADVVAVDQSERMVDLARARAVEATVADVQALPYADGAFDAAHAAWMLYHVPDLDRALAEIARILRPGGRFVTLHNSERHLEELWGVDHGDTFTAENGGERLRAHFGRVDVREIHGAATFAARENLVGYLRAFETLHGRDETWRAAAVALPFRVSCRNVVFVAEKS